MTVRPKNQNISNNHDSQPLHYSVGVCSINLSKQKRQLLKELARDISDPQVLKAIEAIPREIFVPENSRHLAYENIPLAIPYKQTISQPLIVAIMVASLNLTPTSKVLELGTGSGYQTAILSFLADKVITVERLPSLAAAAKAIFPSLGYGNIVVRHTEHVLGCPEHAPYDAIIVSAGAPTLPSVLLDQLAVAGRMVIPVGKRQEQDLLLVEKTPNDYSVKSLGPCRFVPLIGVGAWAEDVN